MRASLFAEPWPTSAAMSAADQLLTSSAAMGIWLCKRNKHVFSRDLVRGLEEQRLIDIVVGALVNGWPLTIHQPQKVWQICYVLLASSCLTFGRSCAAIDSNPHRSVDQIEVFVDSIISNS